MYVFILLYIQLYEAEKVDPGDHQLVLISHFLPWIYEIWNMEVKEMVAIGYQ